MKYIIRKKPCKRNKWTKKKLFIRKVKNHLKIVVGKEEASEIEEELLPKIYKKYGRKNLIVRKVKEVLYELDKRTEN